MPFPVELEPGTRVKLRPVQFCPADSEPILIDNCEYGQVVSDDGVWIWVLVDTGTSPWRFHRENVIPLQELPTERPYSDRICWYCGCRRNGPAYPPCIQRALDARRRRGIMTRSDEVRIRLDRILMRYELVDWSEAIRNAFIGDLPETACDQPGLDAIHDRLDDLCAHLVKLEKLLEARRKPRWTIRIERWTITATRE